MTHMIRFAAAIVLLFILPAQTTFSHESETLQNLRKDLDFFIVHPDVSGVWVFIPHNCPTSEGWFGDAFETLRYLRIHQAGIHLAIERTGGGGGEGNMLTDLFHAGGGIWGDHIRFDTTLQFAEGSGRVGTLLISVIGTATSISPPVEKDDPARVLIPSGIRPGLLRYRPEARGFWLTIQGYSDSVPEYDYSDPEQFDLDAAPERHAMLCHGTLSRPSADASPR